jgi:hypothetical protein
MTDPFIASSDAGSQMTEKILDDRPLTYKPLFSARFEIRLSISRCKNSIKDFFSGFLCLVLTVALFPLLILFSLIGNEPAENNLPGIVFSLILKNWFSLSLYLGAVLIFCYFILRAISGAIVWGSHYL